MPVARGEGGTSGVRPERRRPFMGLPLDCLTMAETLAAVDDVVEARVPRQHVVLNVGKVVMADRDPKLAAIIHECAIVNADGAGVVWGARFLGVPVPERVTGIDLFLGLVERAAERGWRPFFLGARPEVVSEVVERARAANPGLVVAGARDGYWSDDEDADVVAEIRRSGADLLFVAITSPKKEYWLARWIEELGVPFSMGVGGAFDVVAGVTRRAPRWTQRVGLEWLFRLVQEPRRMWKRYLVGNSRFAVMLVTARMRRLRADRSLASSGDI